MIEHGRLLKVEILIQQKKELKELWLWNQNKKLDTLSIFKQLKKRDWVVCKSFSKKDFRKLVLTLGHFQVNIQA